VFRTSLFLVLTSMAGVVAAQTQDPLAAAPVQYDDGPSPQQAAGNDDGAQQPNDNTVMDCGLDDQGRPLACPDDQVGYTPDDEMAPADDAPLFAPDYYAYEDYEYYPPYPYYAGVSLWPAYYWPGYAWGWGGWGWGWGGPGMYMHHSVWVMNPRYVSPRPYYRPRPPIYGRPIYVRPPANWYARPAYRPPPAGYRPYGPNYPGYRPGMPAGYRPPPPAGGYRPPPSGAVNRPPGDVGAIRSSTGGGDPPGNVGAARPVPASRPATGAVAPTPRPQPQPGGRQGAFEGSRNGASERQASARGHASEGGRGGRHR